MSKNKTTEKKKYKILYFKDNPKPKSLVGHIIVFNKPLIVHKTIMHEELITEGEHKGGKRISFERTGEVAKCKFMRAEDGFGCFTACSGRMITGQFFKSIQDIIKNSPFDSGNTKDCPDGYIPFFYIKEVEE